MVKTLCWIVTLVVCAVLTDTVLAPLLLGGRGGFCFAAAGAALVGLRRGRRAGLAGGWLAGALQATFSCGPPALAMFCLGLSGLCGGFLRKTCASMDLPALDMAFLTAVLVLHELVAALAARLVVGAPGRLELAGVVTTLAVLLPLVLAGGGRKFLGDQRR